MINLNRQLKRILVCLFMTGSVTCQAQQTLPINVKELIALALQNHPQLKLSKDVVEVAKQQKVVARLQQLPNLSAAASAMYLGDVFVVDKDFSKSIHIPSPNFGNSYTLQASELIFKGGLVKKSLELADLRTQLSELDLETNQQAIKFLVISNYLDLYKLYNQKKVYENNKMLAEQRMENVHKFYTQGMVTRNEVIRNELNIKTLDQGILVTKNNLAILNFNLDLALGLSTETLLLPTASLEEPLNKNDLKYCLDLANDQNPQLKLALKNIELSDKNISLIKTEGLPSISAIAGYNMQKPITNRIPVLDMYSNTWSIGVTINYNIDNLYKTKKKVKLGELQKSQSKDLLEITQQNVTMAINAAFIKHEEAQQNVLIMKESMRLAQENYRIIEAKYLNQLAIQAEMTDATNAKLESEINYSNAEINVLYQYYNLLKSTGTL